MGNETKSRKWVVKAIIAFVVVLALLTFFSNTIMNATIPKVVGKSPARGNLSYSNNATATVEAVDAVKYEVPAEIDGRTVDTAYVSDWDYVFEGDLLFTLKVLEDETELEQLQTELDTMLREKQYEEMMPSNPTDYSSYDSQIDMAKQTLEAAQATLAEVQNKDATIAEANSIIEQYSPTVVSKKAEIEAITSTMEEINRDIDAANNRLDTINTSINVFVTLGTPTPQPTPLPGEIPTYNPEDTVIFGDGIRADITDEPSGEPETSPEPTAEPTSEPVVEPTAEPTSEPVVEPTAEPTSEPTAVPTAEPTAEPTSEPTPVPTAEPTAAPTAAPIAPGSMEDLMEQRGQVEEEIRNLEAQLEGAQARLNSASTELADANSHIADANAVIEAANSLPTLSAAQSAVNQASSALTQAQKSLSTQQANDQVQALKDKDTKAEQEEKIEKLKKQIEELKAKMEIVEVYAPATGYVFNMAIGKNDVLTKGTTALNIVPNSTNYCVKFRFDSTAAQKFYVGMELTPNEYYVTKCVITNIKPDANDPRNSKIVECAIEGDIWPGETITVVADKANKDYEAVIASSAINEDNNGKFVYIIEQSSTPLGDKAVVKRVAVTVEENDGSRSAIKGDGISNDVLIVVRSDVPLNNGDRVRLEDYSQN